MGDGALAGLRVLEAGPGVAIGYAGKLLADQGADVVRRIGHDPWRHWSAATPDQPLDGDGPLHSFLHAGKDDRDVPDAWADVVLADAAWAGAARDDATV